MEKMSPPKKKTSSLKGWLIRKTQKKTQSFRYKNKNNKNIGNKKTLNKNKVTQNHKLHRSNLQRTITTS